MKLQNTLRTLAFMLLIALGSTQCFAQTTDTIPDTEYLTFAEQMPEFVGGPDALNRFLSSQIKYPNYARDNNKEGKVVITFIVGMDGKIYDVKQIGKRIGYGMDEEAIRVVKTMPKWAPGSQDGKPVAVKFTLPILFKLK